MVISMNQFAFCFCDITLSKTILEGKDVFQLTSSMVAMERDQGKNLEAGTDAETMQQHCLVTGSA